MRGSERDGGFGEAPDPREGDPSIERSELRGAIVDLAGAAIFAALVGWTILAGVVSGGDPASVAGLAAASSMSVLVGRVAGKRSRIIIPVTMVVVALILAVRMPPDDLIGSGPLGGPFGYSNATGAFFAQAGVAAVILAVVSRGPVLRTVGWLAWAGLAAFAAGSRSITATALVVTLPVAALAIARWGKPRVAVAAFAGLFMAVVVATVVVGATYPSHTPDAVDDAIAKTVGPRRAVLWRDAVVIMAAEPLTGAGLDSFQRLSPAARSDTDARWAHNEFLEVGAATGVPGLSLLVLVFLWSFVRLWVTPGDAVIALGAAAVAALGIHASIDYVMHFPAIPISAAALLGSTTVASRA